MDFQKTGVSGPVVHALGLTANSITLPFRQTSNDMDLSNKENRKPESVLTTETTNEESGITISIDDDTEISTQKLIGLYYGMN